MAARVVVKRRGTVVRRLRLPPVITRHDNRVKRQGNQSLHRRALSQTNNNNNNAPPPAAETFRVRRR
jgi:hypothetical protein